MKHGFSLTYTSMPIYYSEEVLQVLFMNSRCGDIQHQQTTYFPTGLSWDSGNTISLNSALDSGYFSSSGFGCVEKVGVGYISNTAKVSVEDIFHFRIWNILILIHETFRIPSVWVSKINHPLSYLLQFLQCMDIRTKILLELDRIGDIVAPRTIGM